MKKLFITLLIALAGMSASAQIWAGGSLDFLTNKNYTSFSIAPEVGYNLPDSKFTVALSMRYDYENPASILSDNNGMILSPYLRYSVMEVEKFILFADLTFDFGMAGYSGYCIGLQSGIAWMATEHWTAAFRFGFLGYDALNANNGSFRMSCASSAPAFGLFYNF